MLTRLLQYGQRKIHILILIWYPPSPPPLRLILAVNFSVWSTLDVGERAAFSLGMLFHFKILNNMGIMGIKFCAF